MNLPVTADDVARAAEAIAGAVVRTPAARSLTLSAITGTDVFLKFETLQFTASFKERGALNKCLALDKAGRRRGVVAMSAGNFAQALAYHATRLGLPVTIVMPVDTPFQKLAGTRQLGARVVLKGADLSEASREADKLASVEGMVPVSPFDDAVVIAGQGTVAIELLQDVPELETLVVPVGGGGLVAGMAVAARALKPAVEIVGVQSESYPSMIDALEGRNGSLGGPTIADGIAVSRAGLLTRQIVAELVDEVITVPESRIEEAICLYLEVEKTVTEGAGAVPLAALLEYPDRFSGKTCGLVVSGGNIDLRLLGSVIMRGLFRSGRLTRVQVDIPDSPGSLARLTGEVGSLGGNIVEVSHQRDLLGVPSREADVELLIETPDRESARVILSSLQRSGFSVRSSSSRDAARAEPDDNARRRWSRRTAV